MAETAALARPTSGHRSLRSTRPMTLSPREVREIREGGTLGTRDGSSRACSLSGSGHSVLISFACILPTFYIHRAVKACSLYFFVTSLLALLKCFVPLCSGGALSKSLDSVFNFGKKAMVVAVGQILDKRALDDWVSCFSELDGFVLDIAWEVELQKQLDKVLLTIKLFDFLSPIRILVLEGRRTSDRLWDAQSSAG